MSGLDDFPFENPSEPIQCAAETNFEAMVRKVGHIFAIQQSDRRDYGTDYQLELVSHHCRTNHRMHVQLKGTTRPIGSDGALRFQVARTNLNYLLSQPWSIYVGFSVEVGQLFYRLAEDVYSEVLERDTSIGTSMGQNTITVRLLDILDERALERLHPMLLANMRAARNARIRWKVEAPTSASSILHAPARPIQVPPRSDEAKQLLDQLRTSGADATISAAFEQFYTVLEGDWGAIADLYFAEIDLASNNHSFDPERIAQAIPYLTQGKIRRDVHPGSMSYCLGNAYSALDQNDKAVSEYREALQQLEPATYSALRACCLKNLGTSLEKIGLSDAAKSAYEEAIMTDPDHADAHYALAQWHSRFDKNWNSALAQLDLVLQKRRYSAVSNRHITGLRAECLFQTGNLSDGFRLVWELATLETGAGWEWGWCARLVSSHGLKSVESANQALKFWRRFLERDPDNQYAEDENFRCLLFLDGKNDAKGLGFADLKNLGLKVIANGTSEAAWVWDRLGHWAQGHGDWREAEDAFANAAREEPETYAFCHAVALNEIGEFEAALGVLQLEAKRRPNDELVWFQIGYAYGHLGDFESSGRAYERALELDPTYSAALFNLGGMKWNAGDRLDAVAIWQIAITRFPSHELAQRLRTDLPAYFGMM